MSKSNRQDFAPATTQKWKFWKTTTAHESKLKSEDQANVFSRLLFLWILPVILASTRRMNLQNYPLLHPGRTCESKLGRLRASFLKNAAQLDPRFPLLRAMVTACWGSLLRALLLSIASIVLDYANIVFFYFFWKYLNDGQIAKAAGQEVSSYGTGVMWIGCICLVHLAVDLTRVHSHYATRMVDANVRTALIAMAAEKWFLLDPCADVDVSDDRHDSDRRPGLATADAMTLATVHSQRIGDIFTASIAIIQYFANIPCLAAWLGYFLGWMGAVAVAIMVVCTVTAVSISLHALKIRRAANMITDERVRKLEGMLMGIRLIKFFGWEDYFLDRLLALREKEVKTTRRATLWTSIHGSLASSSINYAAMAAFALYALGHPLQDNPAVVISGIVFLTIDRNTWQLFRALTMFLNSWPSMARMQQYLLAENQDRSDTVHAAEDGFALQLHGAAFAWENTSLKEKSESPDVTEPKSLMHSPIGRQAFGTASIDLQIRTSELVAVVGPSQAGKTSILLGLLGDMPLREGLLRARGTPAYCPQHAWIQSATVRDNIVFGQEFDANVYDQVIEACSLQADIHNLPQGDHSQLGEGGTQLSGGQKHRVHLARCIYQALVTKQSIVLLDDPLSAVDAKTSAILFDQAIMKLLSRTARLLVTHQLHVLSRCDRVLFVKGGKVLGDGTFQHLLDTLPDFNEYVGSHGQSAICQIPPVSTWTPQPDEAVHVEDVDMAVLDDEERADLRVPWSLYLSFISAPRAKFELAFNTTLLIISQIAVALISLQTAWWSSDKWNVGYAGNVALYVGFTMAHQLTWGPYNYLAQRFIMTRSSLLSANAMRGLLAAPVSFYNANPTGRLINRFTADISELDTVLPINFWNFTLPLFFAASTLCSVLVYVPIVASLLLPWMTVGGLIFYVYKSAPLETKRLSVNLSSQYLALLHEGLVGRTTIKLAGFRDGFLSCLFARIDDYNRIEFASFAILECASLAHSLSYLVMMFCGGLILVARRFDEGAPELALVFALFIVTLSLAQTILDTGTLCQKGVNSIERLKHFAEDLPSEGARYDAGAITAGTWPSMGAITFRGVSLRYKRTLPDVLRSLSFQISGREKIGIVGRTGAGKSSLITAMLRLEELSAGQIIIDGVDLSKVGLYDIRHSISTIPQDPQMFVGDVRYNLDPTGEIDDERLEAALSQVFPDRDCADPGALTLDTEVQPGGSNFSSGELQMLSLARALARDNKIIIIDEATSNVDPAMDFHVQKTIREVFADRTVLTIAHRLRTVLSYDRVIVLDEGRVAEIGPPRQLFTKETKGLFRALCDQSAIMLEDFE